MTKQLYSYIKPWIKSVIAIRLGYHVGICQAGDALAARSGGENWWRLVRMPMSRLFCTHPQLSCRVVGATIPVGEGSFLPSSFGHRLSLVAALELFSHPVFMAIGGYLLQTFRRVTGNDSFEADVYNPQVAIAEVQVGLLAGARDIQSKLDRLALTANPDTPTGECISSKK